MNHFILDGRYEDLLSHYKFNVEEALKKANIPEDCFKKLHPSMSEQQYYNFIAAIGDQISDPFTPIEIATTNPIESFSPPIFAAYSSRNGDIFIKRLAKYKKLIGPLSFKIDEDSKQLSITLTPSNQQYSLPSFLVLSEFAFLVGLLRKTTKEAISPLKITMTSPPSMMSRSLTSLAAKSNRVKAKPSLLPKKTCRSILLVITKQCGIISSLN